MFCIYKNGSFFSETPIDILGLFCYNQSSIGNRRELISLHFLIQKTCELSSCNDAVYLPSSTTYLPLFQWMNLLFWCIRLIMFAFCGLFGCKCNNLLLNTIRYQIKHWIRVQEASGSNPDTPTKNLESASAGSRFFIGVPGFERPLRKHAGGMFLGRGRIHFFQNVSLWDVG